MTPFFRCVGGKRRVAGRIVDMFPACTHYWEPFVGGGAVFWELKSRGYNGWASLSDADSAITSLWTGVRDCPDFVYDGVQEWFELVASATDKIAVYKLLRESWTSGADASPGAQLALRALSFRGLWQTNAAGEYNVPPDKERLQKLPSITRENLREVSKALQVVDVYTTSAMKAPLNPGEGWVVYCDPPYVDNWSKYGVDPFTWEDQRALLDKCAEWHAAGAHVYLSNRATPTYLMALAEQWPAATVEITQVGQLISGKVSGRGTREDLLAWT